MSAGQEGDTLGYGRHGPYGSIGDGTGVDALQLLDNLLAPKTPMPFEPGEAPRWDEADWSGFDHLYALQGGMDCIDPSWNVDGLSTGELIRPWQHLTTALPFSEAERFWMIDASREHWRKHRTPDLSNEIVTVETTVMSAGLRQVLRGRDLVRRWASWRREADEFAAQGSLTTAIFLLDHMAYELVPDEFSKPAFRDRYPNVALFDARVR
jgi:hypothetical protein